MIRKLASRVSQVLAQIGTISLVLAVFLITASITRRFFTGRDIVGVINFIEFLLVVVTFFGLGWTQLKRGHVSTGVIVDRLSKVKRVGVEVFGTLITLFFATILIWASWSSAIEAYQAKETAFASGMLISVWQFRFALPIGIALYIAVIIFDLKDGFFQLLKRR